MIESITGSIVGSAADADAAPRHIPRIRQQTSRTAVALPYPLPLGASAAGAAAEPHGRVNASPGGRGYGRAESKFQPFIGQEGAGAFFACSLGNISSAPTSRVSGSRPGLYWRSSHIGTSLRRMSCQTESPLRTLYSLTPTTW